MAGRFDPGECAGNCPMCGAGVSVESGQPTPQHQETGTLNMCAGSGAPAL